MTRKWIVAHDFSDEAALALDHAARVLQALGDGELVLAHVHAPITTGFAIDLGATAAFQDVDRTLEHEAEGRLAELAKAVAEAHPGLTVRAVVEPGAPADHLVELAKREGAEHIVVGSHGRKGLERFFLGSVAERVVRLSECPVTVVKGKPTAA